MRAFHLIDSAQNLLATGIASARRFDRDIGLARRCSQANALGGGCLDEDSGLTAYGRQIIDEMEEVGMVLCCTHVGHRTALEALEYSRNPGFGIVNQN